MSEIEIKQKISESIKKELKIAIDNIDMVIDDYYPSYVKGVKTVSFNIELNDLEDIGSMFSFSEYSIIDFLDKIHAYDSKKVENKDINNQIGST